ncbi:MAG: hypothetical protein ABIP93_06600, partial [Gemmatimonadaceae bacterium]
MDRSPNSHDSGTLAETGVPTTVAPGELVPSASISAATGAGSAARSGAGAALVSDARAGIESVRVER